MGENEMINVIKFSYKFCEGQKPKQDEVSVMMDRVLTKQEALDFVKCYYFKKNKPFQVIILNVRGIKE